MPTQEEVFDALSNVMDPELGMPITELGLVYDVNIVNDRADVKMTLTSPGCPLGATITDMVRDAVTRVEGINDATVEIIWDPPWSVDMMSDEARMRLGMF
jgi:metal-sulfur cluster biosynthetic enzyme